MKVIHTELKVNLPNHEYTKVGIKPGLSIADALSKAMKKRNLDTKTYEAIMVSDPEKVSNFSVQKNAGHTKKAGHTENLVFLQKLYIALRG